MKMNHRVPQGDNQDFGLWSDIWHHQISGMYYLSLQQTSNTFIYHDRFAKHSYILDLFAFYINLMTYMSL